MLWNSLFIINAAQGLFLITIFLKKAGKNKPASLLISAMVAIMVITNFGYLTIRTELINIIPKAYIIPFGTILLIGPLFYFYTKSVTESSFKIGIKNLIHFLPYFVQIIYYIPYYMIDNSHVAEFARTFLSGRLPINTEGKITFALQESHLLFYMFLTFRLIYPYNTLKENAYVIAASLRYNWLKQLFFCFVLFSLTLAGLYIFVLINGEYNPVTNYLYTIITSGIIYFISYKLVFTPELLTPDFTMKYKTYKTLNNREEDKYLQRLNQLMNDEKVFTDPELKLTILAERTGLPSHQLSKLINEKFGKSYNDYINEYRVNEFISRINAPEYKAYSIYGIALDVGFNSKSSFNSAFKKITGKNPSEFKASE